MLGECASHGNTAPIHHRTISVYMYNETQLVTKLSLFTVSFEEPDEVDPSVGQRRRDTDVSTAMMYII